VAAPGAYPSPHPPEPARHRIAAAAVRLFCEKGYEATSVREIVAAAGVTKPVLYYYFQSKEELFHRVLRDATDHLTAELTAACAASRPTFTEQLGGIARVYFDAARAYPDAVRFVHVVAFSGVYQHVLDFAAYWEGNMRLLFGVFARAQQAGWLRQDLSPRTAAFHFLSLVLGTMRAIVYFPRLAATEPLEASLVPLFLDAVDGLTPSCAAAEPPPDSARVRHLPSAPQAPEPPP